MPQPLSLENRNEILQTNGVLALACLIIGHIFSLGWTSWAAVVFLIIGLFFQRIGALIHRGWFGFSFYVGALVSTLFLTLVFYGFLTPLALLYRFFHKDPIGLEKKSESYYHQHSVQFDKTYFERLW